MQVERHVEASEHEAEEHEGPYEARIAPLGGRRVHVAYQVVASQACNCEDVVKPVTAELVVDRVQT